MTESAKMVKSCEENISAPWQPLRNWWQFNRIFVPGVGLPPLLAQGDTRWTDVDWFRRSPAACYTPAPLSVPYISESMPHPGQKISIWRVSMDVAHFFPSEILLSVRDRFLEVKGKHEERPDEYGFMARCFTRKYRLPDEMDATKLTSTLSVDGILTVEAPVPETSAPSVIIIPIKVETEETEEQEVKIGDKGEESQSEVQSDQDQPSSTTTGLEQKDDETQEKPAGETHPSVPADDKILESLQQSSGDHKTIESQDSPVTSNQLEHKEPSMDGEIQVKEEGVEELTQPEEQELGTSPLLEVQSQELEAADIKQQHTE